MCRFCDLEQETSSHLLTDCEALCFQRNEHFNTHFLSKTEPHWKTNSLKSLLNSKYLADIEEDEDYIPSSQDIADDSIHSNTPQDDRSSYSGIVVGSFTQLLYPALTG